MINLSFANQRFLNCSILILAEALGKELIQYHAAVVCLLFALSVDLNGSSSIKFLNELLRIFIKIDHLTETMSKTLPESLVID